MTACFANLYNRVAGPPESAQWLRARMTSPPRALFLALAAVWLTLPPVTLAQDAPPAADEGLFITVPNPITGEAAARVKETVERAVTGGRVRKIVFDFNPSGQPACRRA